MQSNITIRMVNEATIGDYSAVIDDTRTNPVTTPNQLVSFPCEYCAKESDTFICPFSIVPPTSVSLTSSLGCLLNGMVVRLTCVSDGLPTPEITFEKNLIPITCNPGSSCNISNNVLTFKQVCKSMYHIDQPGFHTELCLGDFHPFPSKFSVSYMKIIE